MTLNIKDRLADTRIRVHVLERELRAAQIAQAQLQAEYDRALAAEKADTERPPAGTTLDVDGGWT